MMRIRYQLYMISSNVTTKLLNNGTCDNDLKMGTFSDMGDHYSSGLVRVRHVPLEFGLCHLCFVIRKESREEIKESFDSICDESCCNTKWHVLSKELPKSNDYRFHNQPIHI